MVREKCASVNYLNTHLESQQRKDRQTKQGEDDDILEVLDRVDDSADDCLEAGDDSHRLQSPKHPDSPESGEAAKIDSERNIGHGDDYEVQPVPGVSQVGEVIHDQTPGKEFDGRLVGVDGREDDLSGGGVSKIVFVFF